MALKKVLIITYYWPPSGGGGVQRWLKFVKYLRLYQWEPVVYTPVNPEMPSVDESLLKEVPDNVQVVKSKIFEPYTFYKVFTGKKPQEKIQTAFLSEKKQKISVLENVAVWIRGNLFIPDARKFWIRPSVKKLTAFLKEHPVDAIVTTGPPHSMHLIGMQLHQKLGIPWLADFRDPWTNIDFYEQLKLGKRADRKHHRLEKQVLTLAPAVTVVSPGMKKDFLRVTERTYHVIPNGFDAEDLRLDKPVVPDPSRFVLAHIGSLTKTRNAENLWKVLNELTREFPEFARKLEIRNVGKIDVDAVESIRKYGLEKYLHRVDYLPHDQVIAEQNKAAVLLLFINRTPNAKLILTGKLFEYIASKRPVICIGPPDGDAARIVTETGCGTVFDFDETEKLKKQLLLLYRSFTEGTEKQECQEVERYERKNLTAQMAAVLDEITTKTR